MAASKTMIDDKWFRLMTDRAKESQRSLAAKIGMDPSSWVRVLQGKRRLQLNEADRVADVLGVPVEEVLRHAGLRIEVPKGRGHVVHGPGDPLPSLGGTIDMTGQVVFSGLSGKTTPRDAVRALEIVGDPFLEGKHVLYAPGDVAASPSGGPEINLVQLTDGRVVLRKIKPAFTPGRWDLGPALGFGGKDGREDDMEIVGVIPVLGVRF
jgi:hypothetical protein